MGHTCVTVMWLLFLLVSGREISANNMTPAFVFDQIDFEFPSDSIKQAATDSGAYTVGNSNPFAIDVWSNKLFITIPRWLNGSGPTLNYVKIGKNLK